MRFIAAVAMLILASWPAQADRLDELWTKFHLVEFVSRLDLALDERDWDVVFASFDDLVQIRFWRIHSVVTGPGLVRRWRQLYFPGKSVFHMTTNHIVDLNGDTASMVADGHVWNRVRGAKGGDEWEVWGRFRYGFVRKGGQWRIDRFEFVPEREVGNRGIAVSTGIAQDGDLSAEKDDRDVAPAELAAEVFSANPAAPFNSPASEASGGTTTNTDATPPDDGASTTPEPRNEPAR